MKMSFILLFLFMFGNILSNTSNGGFDVSTLKVAQYADQIMITSPFKYNESDAMFWFFEKNESGKWENIIITRAHIGKNGLGKEKEGDNKTPIGLFDFTKKFGIADNPGCPLEYIKVDDTMYWVGDSNSTMYNKMVSTKDYNDFDKSQSEHLIDYPEAYKYATNINYNPEGTPYLGSAIFLHCYTKNPFTGGCVAIPERHMETIMKRIKEKAYIIIDEVDKITDY